MATSVYPRRPEKDILRDEKSNSARELAWLRESLQETIASIRSGLQECSRLILPTSTSTLAISSPRSECLKGFATRAGDKIVKADMQVKMYGLPNTKGLPSHKLVLLPEKSLMLEQLTDVGNHVSESLEMLNHEGNDVGEMLKVVRRNVGAAREALRGASSHRLFPNDTVDSRAFDPQLHPNLAFNLYISEAALVVELRTLEQLAPTEHSKSTFALPSLAVEPSSGFRERFAAAVGLGGRVGRGGDDEIYSYKGGNVRVRERVKVESQDPSLMAAWAKLGGLEHALVLAIKALDAVENSARPAHEYEVNISSWEGW